MADLAQFQDQQPILQAPKIESRASGYDDFAKTLGEMTSQSEEQAETINKEQSQSMYINSVANIEQLKTGAQMQMLEHPDQAPKIAENMQSAADAVKQAAFVNNSDRAKLNAYIDGQSDSVALDATRAQVHQSQLSAAFTHFANWPAQLNAYNEAIAKGDPNADNIRDGIMANLKNLVQTGALTPEQAGNSIKSMSNVVDMQQDYVNVFNNPDATAKDYHAANSNVLNQNPASNLNTPIDENTAWVVNHHVQDASVQGVLSDLYDHKIPDMATYESLPKDARQHVGLTYQGIRQADGLINSGTSFPEIEQTYKNLTTKGDVLSYSQTGLRNKLGQYVNKIKNGNYLDAISGTPAGGVFMQNFVNKNAAIQNSAMDDAGKQVAMANNLNDMVTGAVSYGYGHHIPADKIQPIPVNDVATLKTALTVGNDPSAVFNVLSKYRPNNRIWVAQSLPDPLQQSVVNTVNLSGDSVPASDKLNYIAANQKGRDYLNVNQESQKTGLSTVLLSGLVASSPQIKSALNVIGVQYDPYKAQQIQKSVVDSAVNYVKYLAAQNNDPGLSNKNDYINKAASLIGSAYPQVSSTNYIANPKQLNLTPGEMDLLASYVVNQGYGRLQQGVNKSVYMAARYRSNLKMTVSPTNDVMAVDSNNHVYWKAPFTTKMIGAAKALQNKQQQDASQVSNQMTAFQMSEGG